MKIIFYQQWLSQIASNYEEYEFKQLIFSFKSTVSEFQTTNGVVGQVVGVTQYNPGARPFTDKQTMVSYHGAVSGKTNSNFYAGVECDPAKLAGSPGKYVRFQELDLGQDRKDYDLGTFSIATVDVPSALSNQVIGELWVSYTVMLRRPKLVVSRALTIQQDMFACIGRAPDTGVTWLNKGPLSADNVQNQPFSLDSTEFVFCPQNSIGCHLKIVKGDTKIDDGSAAGIKYPYTIPVGGAIGGITYPDGMNFEIASAPLTEDGVCPGDTDAAKQLVITFPAQYSGTVEVSLAVGGSAQIDTGNFFHARWLRQGNVAPISDMFLGRRSILGQVNPPYGLAVSTANSFQQHSCASFTSARGTYGIPVSGTNVDLNCKYSSTIHVDVQQATGGIDNQLRFQLACKNTAEDPGPPVIPAGTPVHIVNGELKIAEYNAGMNNFDSERPDWALFSNKVTSVLPDVDV